MFLQFHNRVLKRTFHWLRRHWSQCSLCPTPLWLGFPDDILVFSTSVLGVSLLDILAQLAREMERICKVKVARKSLWLDWLINDFQKKYKPVKMKHADTRTECWGFQLRGTTKLRIVGPVSKWLFSSFKSTISMSLSAAINIKPPAVNQVNYQVRQTPWQHRPYECRTSTHHIKLRVHRVVHLVARQNHVFPRDFQ